MKVFWTALTTQRRIKAILDASDKHGERVEAFRQLARQLGANPDFGAGEINWTPQEQSLLIERIQTAAREYRNGIGWLIAFASSVAAILSAIAAWVAVSL
jgi:hypothetical protein